MLGSNNNNSLGVVCLPTVLAGGEPEVMASGPIPPHFRVDELGRGVSPFLSGQRQSSQSSVQGPEEEEVLLES